MWNHVIPTVPIYGQYQTMTAREIPVVVFDPA